MNGIIIMILMPILVINNAVIDQLKLNLVFIITDI